MGGGTPISKKTTSLRKQAESKLRKQKGGSLKALPAQDIQNLVHELQVHQIELEMQNEELRSAHDPARRSAQQIYRSV